MDWLENGEPTDALLDVVGLRESGLDWQEIGDKLGVTKEQARGAYRRHRDKIDDDEVRPAEVIVDPRMVQMEKAKAMQRHSTRLSKQVAKERARTEIIVEELSDVIAAMEPPSVDVPYIKPTVKGKSEVAKLMISDVHVGKLVDPSETGGLGHYNMDVFAERLENLKRSVTDILSIHSKAYTIEKLVIDWLGDIVDGESIYRGQPHHLDADLTQQILTAANEFSGFVGYLSQLVPEVECVAVYGNHGRVGRKGESKGHVNFDYLLYHFMAERLANYENVSWKIPKAWFTIEDTLGHGFLIQHGDAIRSWNGIPWYGLQRANNKLTKVFTSQGKRFRYMEVGHMHNPAEIDTPDGELLMNGSWPGGDDYSLKQLSTMTRPRQKIFGVNERYGKTWSYNIDLS